MKAPDLIVSSSRVVTPEGVRPGSVVVAGGVIVAVERPGIPAPDAPHPEDAPHPDAPHLDAGDAIVMPGLVDSHVHVNDPGRADWEGFETATKGAAAGGITTLVDMPLNSSPVTITPAALEAKTAAAEGRCWVDYGVGAGSCLATGTSLRRFGKQACWATSASWWTRAWRSSRRCRSGSWPGCSPS